MSFTQVHVSEMSVWVVVAAYSCMQAQTRRSFDPPLMMIKVLFVLRCVCYWDRAVPREQACRDMLLDRACVDAFMPTAVGRANLQAASR